MGSLETKLRTVLGFDSYVADAADEIVRRRLAFFDSHDFDGISLVLGTENQVIAGGFDILDGASPILKYGIHAELALAVGLKRIVVAVDEQGRAWE